MKIHNERPQWKSNFPKNKILQRSHMAANIVSTHHFDYLSILDTSAEIAPISSTQTRETKRSLEYLEPILILRGSWIWWGEWMALQRIFCAPLSIRGWWPAGTLPFFCLWSWQNWKCLDRWAFGDYYLTFISHCVMLYRAFIIKVLLWYGQKMKISGANVTDLGNSWQELLQLYYPPKGQKLITRNDSLCYGKWK